jgi:hypothetical protein
MLQRFFMNYAIILTLFLIPCIAVGSDEIDKGDSDYGKNFGLTATQEICDRLEKDKEEISETIVEVSKRFGSDAAEKIGKAIITVSTFIAIVCVLKALKK